MIPTEEICCQISFHSTFTAVQTSKIKHNFVHNKDRKIPLREFLNACMLSAYRKKRAWKGNMTEKKQLLELGVVLV